MKNLFLTSYFSGAANLLPKFAGGLSQKKVCFIPTASIVEKITFYVDADKKALFKLGLEVNELEISNAGSKEIKDKIANADIVFVEGGNTFFLLQELKRTKTDELILEHIKKSKLYIGASAGAMVVCPNIEYVKYMDNPGKAPKLNGNFSALNIVDFYIVAHYGEFPFKKASQKIIADYSEKIDLRLINNKQAIAVKGGKVEILTTSKKEK
ncbi:MAG: Type 1 glutamine amidotransferase-like domain-containing protein [Endomicrobium sp.]|jgi:dipeptidase E|nr:Type 1 glutamine amidotransferase-like domain-containing protein [Endomicrobium sp.]